MKISRSALSVNVIDGKLYAMGGYDGNHFLSNVEVYNPLDDSWEDGVPLTSGRSGLASAVIYQPSCSQPYTQENKNSIQRGEYDDNRSQQYPQGSASGSNSSSTLQSRHFNPTRGFSSGDLNQDHLGDQYSCDEDIPVEDRYSYNGIKKLKTSVELIKNNIGHYQCPLQSFKKRIKRFLHKRKRHPCKLKPMFNAKFN